MKAYFSLMGILWPKIKQIIHIPIGIYKPPISIVLVLLCFVFSAKAQEVEVHSTPVAEADSETNQSEIIPLKIGDRVPDELWNLPLEVVNHPDGKETVTLSDYRDKLIILDFWATWCSSCISSFPAVQKIVDRFRGHVRVIPVTLETPEKTRSFFNTNEKAKNLMLHSVTSGQTLKEYFPHKLIPHLVWLGKDGRVLSFSNSQELTLSNVESYLEKNKVDVRVKSDIDIFRPLFSVEELKDQKILQYSVFLRGYQSGLPFGSIERTENGKIRGLAIYNATIGEIYRRLYKELGKEFEKDKIELDVNDPDAIWISKIKFEDENWLQDNLYTFELIVPLDHSEKLYPMMLEIVNKDSGYQGEVISGRLRISIKE